MQTLLNNYFKIINEKAKKREKDNEEYNNYSFYLDGIKDEVVEVKEEITKNRSAYLEDELGDILRDYLNVLYYLEKEGKISSWQSVFERSFKKFGERVDGQINGVYRKEVKIKQKKDLENEQKNLSTDEKI